MSTKHDPVIADPMERETTSAHTGAPHEPARKNDEPTATKPPLLWMLVPLVLIALAIFFAR